MHLFFSMTTGGFYDSRINHDIPADAVAITEEEHGALHAGLAAGQIIIADAAGRPMLIDGAATE